MRLGYYYLHFVAGVYILLKWGWNWGLWACFGMEKNEPETLIEKKIPVCF